MSDRPSVKRTRCPSCGHIAGYHQGPRCIGAVGHDVGAFVRGVDERCPCTLTDLEILLIAPENGDDQ